MKKFLLFFVTGCYSGFCPKLSGTAGSAVAGGLWVLLCEAGLWAEIWERGAITLFVFLFGLYAVGRVLPHFAGRAGRRSLDPGEIVIDEWAGLFVSLLSTTCSNWRQALAAFILFRLFDMLKPFPISRAERLPGALGIMFDDILAGAAALLLVEAAPMFVQL
jgi:phosphatidylglycerophosphatase A